MKKLLPILIGLSLTGFSAMSRAENLLQVYQQARISNPDLRKSAADRDAAFEKINEARSPLLPQLGLGADYTYTNGYRDSNGVNSNVTSGSLQLTQVLFDMSKWRALTLQEKTAGIQDVTYQTDRQTLILNTATAYFKVLAAIDTLSYTEAQKQAIYRQLDQTTQRFNVGTVAITDVQNARSQYDAVLANEVTARNDLDNAVEGLRQVTGNYYPELASLNVNGFKTNKPAGGQCPAEGSGEPQPVVAAGASEPGTGPRADSPGAGRPFADPEPFRLYRGLEYALQRFENQYPARLQRQ